MKTLIFTIAIAIILGLCAICLYATPLTSPLTPAPQAPAAGTGSKISYVRGNVLRGAAPALLVTTPTIGTPSLTPSTIAVNTPTTVTVTVSISPAPISNGVNVLRIGATGTQPTILGVMHDDGKNGDAVAGDGIYTLQVPFNEMTSGQGQLQVSVAFQGRLQRILSPIVQLQVWNLTQPLVGSNLPSIILYPPSWVVTPSSGQPSDGLYFSDSAEEEPGHGISLALLTAPFSTVLLDPGYVLINQISQILNGHQWTFVTERDPISGLQFYHGFLQTSSGVIVIGGNDSHSNETIINTMASSLNL